MRVTLEGVCGKRLISLQYRPLALLFFVRDQSQFKLEEGGVEDKLGGLQFSFK